MSRQFKEKDIYLKKLLIQLKTLAIYSRISTGLVLLSYQKLINHCFKYLGKNYGNFMTKFIYKSSSLKVHLYFILYKR